MTHKSKLKMTAEEIAEEVLHPPIVYFSDTIRSKMVEYLKFYARQEAKGLVKSIAMVSVSDIDRKYLNQAIQRFKERNDHETT